MKRREFLDIGLDVGLGLVVAGTMWPRRALAAPTEAPLLDAHVHPRSAALVAHRAAVAPQQPRATVIDGAALVAALDADGVRQAFVLSTAYQMAADVNRATAVDEREEYARVRGDNDFAAAECARFPERLVPFLSVNPKRGYAIDEIDRCVDTHRMRGLKVHLWNSMVDTRDPTHLAPLRRVIAHAASRGLPVVAHIYVGAIADYGPADTERFVREIIEPTESLRICVAHLAGAGGFADPVPACFERLVQLCGPASAMARRTWVDVAAILTRPATEPARRQLGALLTRWGVDRVLWGSDSIDGALALTRAQWPLDDAPWSTIAQNTGTGLRSLATR